MVQSRTAYHVVLVILAEPEPQ